MAGPREFDRKSVFLNVPYDRSYELYFVTLVSTLVSLGQTPHCVLELPESGIGRLARIFDLIRSCGVSVHDLCRVGVPARFNMPFELGIACAHALSGNPHDIVVLDRQRFRLDKTLSDYKGRDPVTYSTHDSLVQGIADAFQIADEPTPAVLKSEARLLRRSATAIASSHGGSLFGRSAFRALVAAATARARSQSLIPP